MTLSEVRAEHPRWTIDPYGMDELLCIGGPFRFVAADPDDAHEGIEWREGRQPPPPGTIAELGAELAAPNF